MAAWQEHQQCRAGLCQAQMSAAHAADTRKETAGTLSGPVPSLWSPECLEPVCLAPLDA
jgi:hypothetical protein